MSSLGKDLLVTGIVVLPVATFAVTQLNAVAACVGSAVGSSGSTAASSPCLDAEEASLKYTLMAIGVSVLGGYALYRTFPKAASRRKLRR